MMFNDIGQARPNPTVKFTLWLKVLVQPLSRNHVFEVLWDKPPLPSPPTLSILATGLNTTIFLTAVIISSAFQIHKYKSKMTQFIIMFQIKNSQGCCEHWWGRR